VPDDGLTIPPKPQPPILFYSLRPPKPQPPILFYSLREHEPKRPILWRLSDIAVLVVTFFLALPIVLGLIWGLWMIAAALGWTS
jgi:hypothetical protein